MSKIINGVIETKDMDCFIIPNPITKVDNWMSESVQKSMTEKATKLCEMNGLDPFDPEKDKLVQMWFVGLGAENMIDHYCHATDENGNEYIFRCDAISRVPVKFFKGKKEKDIIHLEFPIHCEKRHAEDVYEDFIVKAEVRLNQKDYRYARFGEFQKVIEDLGGNM